MHPDEMKGGTAYRKRSRHFPASPLPAAALLVYPVAKMQLHRLPIAPILLFARDPLQLSSAI